MEGRLVNPSVDSGPHSLHLAYCCVTSISINTITNNAGSGPLSFHLETSVRELSAGSPACVPFSREISDQSQTLSVPLVTLPNCYKCPARSNKKGGAYSGSCPRQGSPSQQGRDGCRVMKCLVAWNPLRNVQFYFSFLN